jgi:hypothetical protein
MPLHILPNDVRLQLHASAKEKTIKHLQMLEPKYNIKQHEKVSNLSHIMEHYNQEVTILKIMSFATSPCATTCNQMSPMIINDFLCNYFSNLDEYFLFFSTRLRLGLISCLNCIFFIMSLYFLQHCIYI